MSSVGKAVILPSSAKGLANYPHARLVSAGGTRTLYISGTSSRRADGSTEGFELGDDGTPYPDPGEQTAAILRKMEAVIKQATNGKGGLRNLVDVTVYLTDMAYYGGMNRVWNEFWPNPEDAPARTAVAVQALPGLKMVVEMKATAVV
ncbi:hypothetical protein CEP52_001112 [Fusarium oligoseptatum]|uniref:Uncharacterized protein n=1 Tax=Fusarium oligoseptatum TaxID=2604345 RepID=A0A428UKU2_9HYPO|nr:hypothetical protein CEP52_001112 [Fusarium oligoseptatum]